MCFVTIKCPNDHQFTVFTDDLGRWESWGILSAVRSPIARQLGAARDETGGCLTWLCPELACGSPLREAGGMPHPAHLARPQQFS